jgi:hypothetical protein
VVDPRNDQRSNPRPPDSNTAAQAETLRNASPPSAGEPSKREEQVSLFWRICGGTLLSIAALVIITVWQQLNSSLNDLRTSVHRLTEHQGETIKKEEFSTRTQPLWQNLKELQKSLQEVSTLAAAQKERAMMRDLRLKEEERSREAMQKELQELRSAVALLRERAMLRDQQLREEAERKELVRELQQLRERLALIEGRQASNGVTRASVVTED